MQTRSQIPKPWLWLLVSTLFLLVGCASNPQSRVDRNPELFAQYPDEVREKILAGKVAVGFTTEMAYLALGDPDRKTTSTTAEGVTENWIYLGYRTRSFHAMPHWSPVHDWYYCPRRDTYVRVRSVPRAVSASYSEEYNRMVVRFRDGKVVSFEKMT